jgi:hypothetical protein
MSPVEIWGIPYFWQMKAACVPLPAPGAPNNISLMVSSEGSLNLCRAMRPSREFAGGDGGEDSTRYPTAPKSVGGEKGANAHQIFRRIDPRTRGIRGDVDRDPVAMPKGSKLFERFGGFDRRRRKSGKLPDEAGAIAVDSDVPQRRRIGRQRLRAMGREAVVTTLGLANSSGESMACAAVLMAASG